eukprot:s190_g1.t1
MGARRPASAQGSCAKPAATSEEAFQSEAVAVQGLQHHMKKKIH